MRLLLLSRNATLYSTSRLVLAARSRGHEVSVVDPLDLRIVISRGRPSLFLGDRAVPHADSVLPRIGASITNYGLAVVRQFDLMGVPVLNTALAIARSRDKLRAMQLLTKRNIDVPVTVCARTPDSIDLALSHVGGPPVIVKLQQGAQGIGTMIAETPQAVTSLLETLWAMGQDIVLQQYIAEAKGRDLRAIVVGGRVVAAMRRQAKAGEFRSNLHRGGLGVSAELDASAAAPPSRPRGSWDSRWRASTCSRRARGPKILEINSSPGLEGIERASGIDVAEAIIQHAERFLARRRHRKRSQLDEERRHTRIRPGGPPPSSRPRMRAGGRS